MSAIHSRSVLLQFVEEQCCSCGVRFCMDSYYREQMINSHQWFFCPNGHRQQYAGESDADKAIRLARELEQETTRRRWAETAKEQAETKLRKHKVRTKNGICPCCNRSFTQLARHIKQKHPEFA